MDLYFWFRKSGMMSQKEEMISLKRSDALFYRTINSVLKVSWIPASAGMTVMCKCGHNMVREAFSSVSRFYFGPESEEA